GSRSRDFYVLNETGIDLLRVVRVRFTGPDSAAFKLISYTGQPAGFVPSAGEVFTNVVQASSTSPIKLGVQFSPIKLGEHSATLEVFHDGTNGSPLTLTLNGEGRNDVAV